MYLSSKWIFIYYHLYFVIEIQMIVFFACQSNRIYPSYKVDTGEIEMPKECIENFNTNFSKCGEFEIYAKDIDLGTKEL